MPSICNLIILIHIFICFQQIRTSDRNKCLQKKGQNQIPWSEVPDIYKEILEQAESNNSVINSLNFEGKKNEKKFDNEIKNERTKKTSCSEFEPKRAFNINRFLPFLLSSKLTKYKTNKTSPSYIDEGGTYSKKTSKIVRDKTGQEIYKPNYGLKSPSAAVKCFTSAISKNPKILTHLVKKLFTAENDKFENDDVEISTEYESDESYNECQDNFSIKDKILNSFKSNYPLKTVFNQTRSKVNSIDVIKENDKVDSCIKEIEHIFNDVIEVLSNKTKNDKMLRDRSITISHKKKSGSTGLMLDRIKQHRLKDVNNLKNEDVNRFLKAVLDMLESKKNQEDYFSTQDFGLKTYNSTKPTSISETENPLNVTTFNSSSIELSVSKFDTTTSINLITKSDSNDHKKGTFNRFRSKQMTTESNSKCYNKNKKGLLPVQKLLQRDNEIHLDISLTDYAQLLNFISKHVNIDKNLFNKDNIDMSDWDFDDEDNIDLNDIKISSQPLSYYVKKASNQSSLDKSIINCKHLFNTTDNKNKINVSNSIDKMKSINKNTVRKNKSIWNFNNSSKQDYMIERMSLKNKEDMDHLLKTRSSKRNYINLFHDNSSNEKNELSQLDNDLIVNEIAEYNTNESYTLPKSFLLLNKNKLEPQIIITGKENLRHFRPEKFMDKEKSYEDVYRYNPTSTELIPSWEERFDKTKILPPLNPSTEIPCGDPISLPYFPYFDKSCESKLLRQKKKNLVNSLLNQSGIFLSNNFKPLNVSNKLSSENQFYLSTETYLHDIINSIGKNKKIYILAVDPKPDLFPTRNNLLPDGIIDLSNRFINRTSIIIPKYLDKTMNLGSKKLNEIEFIPKSNRENNNHQIFRSNEYINFIKCSTEITKKIEDVTLLNSSTNQEIIYGTTHFKRLEHRNTSSTPSVYVIQNFVYPTSTEINIKQRCKDNNVSSDNVKQTTQPSDFLNHLVNKELLFLKNQIEMENTGNETSLSNVTKDVKLIPKTQPSINSLIDHSKLKIGCDSQGLNLEYDKNQTNSNNSSSTPSLLLFEKHPFYKTSNTQNKNQSNGTFFQVVEPINLQKFLNYRTLYNMKSRNTKEKNYLPIMDENLKLVTDGVSLEDFINYIDKNGKFVFRVKRKLSTKDPPKFRRYLFNKIGFNRENQTRDSTEKNKINKSICLKKNQLSQGTTESQRRKFKVFSRTTKSISDPTFVNTYVTQETCKLTDTIKSQEMNILKDFTNKYNVLNTNITESPTFVNQKSNFIHELLHSHSPNGHNKQISLSSDEINLKKLVSNKKIPNNINEITTENRVLENQTKFEISNLITNISNAKPRVYSPKLFKTLLTIEPRKTLKDNKRKPKLEVKLPLTKTVTNLPGLNKTHPSRIKYAKFNLNESKMFDSSTTNSNPQQNDTVLIRLYIPSKCFKSESVIQKPLKENKVSVANPSHCLQKGVASNATKKTKLNEFLVNSSMNSYYKNIKIKPITNYARDSIGQQKIGKTDIAKKSSIAFTTSSFKKPNISFLRVFPKSNKEVIDTDTSSYQNTRENMNPAIRYIVPVPFFIPDILSSYIETQDKSNATRNISALKNGVVFKSNFNITITGTHKLVAESNQTENGTPFRTDELVTNSTFSANKSTGKFITEMITKVIEITTKVNLVSGKDSFRQIFVVNTTDKLLPKPSNSTSLESNQTIIESNSFNATTEKQLQTNFEVKSSENKLSKISGVTSANLESTLLPQFRDLSMIPSTASTCSTAITNIINQTNLDSVYELKNQSNSHENDTKLVLPKPTDNSDNTGLNNTFEYELQSISSLNYLNSDEDKFYKTNSQYNSTTQTYYNNFLSMSFNYVNSTTSQISTPSILSSNNVTDQSQINLGITDSNISDFDTNLTGMYDSKLFSTSHPNIFISVTSSEDNDTNNTMTDVPTSQIHEKMPDLNDSFENNTITQTNPNLITSDFSKTKIDDYINSCEKEEIDIELEKTSSSTPTIQSLMTTADLFPLITNESHIFSTIITEKCSKVLTNVCSTNVSNISIFNKIKMNIHNSNFQNTLERNKVSKSNGCRPLTTGISKISNSNKKLDKSFTLKTIKFNNSLHYPKIDSNVIKMNQSKYKQQLQNRNFKNVGSSMNFKLLNVLDPSQNTNQNQNDTRFPFISPSELKLQIDSNTERLTKGPIHETITTDYFQNVWGSEIPNIFSFSLGIKNFKMLNSLSNNDCATLFRKENGFTRQPNFSFIFDHSVSTSSFHEPNCGSSNESSKHTLNALVTKKDENIYSMMRATTDPYSFNSDFTKHVIDKFKSRTTSLSHDYGENTNDVIEFPIPGLITPKANIPSDYFVNINKVKPVDFQELTEFTTKSCTKDLKHFSDSSSSYANSLNDYKSVTKNKNDYITDLSLNRTRESPVILSTLSFVTLKNELNHNSNLIDKLSPTTSQSIENLKLLNISKSLSAQPVVVATNKELNSSTINSENPKNSLLNNQTYSKLSLMNTQNSTILSAVGDTKVNSLSNYKASQNDITASERSINFCSINLPSQNNKVFLGVTNNNENLKLTRETNFKTTSLIDLTAKYNQNADISIPNKNDNNYGNFQNNFLLGNSTKAINDYNEQFKQLMHSSTSKSIFVPTSTTGCKSILKKLEQYENSSMIQATQQLLTNESNWNNGSIKAFKEANFTELSKVTTDSLRFKETNFINNTHSSSTGFLISESTENHVHNADRLQPNVDMEDKHNPKTLPIFTTGSNDLYLLKGTNDQNYLIRNVTESVADRYRTFHSINFNLNSNGNSKYNQNLEIVSSGYTSSTESIDKFQKYIDAILHENTTKPPEVLVINSTLNFNFLSQFSKPNVDLNTYNTKVSSMNNQGIYSTESSINYVKQTETAMSDRFFSSSLIPHSTDSSKNLPKYSKMNSHAINNFSPNIYSALNEVTSPIPNNEGDLKQKETDSAKFFVHTTSVNDFNKNLTESKETSAFTIKNLDSINERKNFSNKHDSPDFFKRTNDPSTITDNHLPNHSKIEAFTLKATSDYSFYQTSSTKDKLQESKDNKMSFKENYTGSNKNLNSSITGSPLVYLSIAVGNKTKIGNITTIFPVDKNLKSIFNQNHSSTIFNTNKNQLLLSKKSNSKVLTATGLNSNTSETKVCPPNNILLNVTPDYSMKETSTLIHHSTEMIHRNSTFTTVESNVSNYYIKNLDGKVVHKNVSPDNLKESVEDLFITKSLFNKKDLSPLQLILPDSKFRRSTLRWSLFDYTTIRTTIPDSLINKNDLDAIDIDMPPTWRTTYIDLVNNITNLDSDKGYDIRSTVSWNTENPYDSKSKTIINHSSEEGFDYSSDSTSDPPSGGIVKNRYRSTTKPLIKKLNDTGIKKNSITDRMATLVKGIYDDFSTVIVEIQKDSTSTDNVDKVQISTMQPIPLFGLLKTHSNESEINGQTKKRNFGYKSETVGRITNQSLFNSDDKNNLHQSLIDGTKEKDRYFLNLNLKNNNSILDGVSINTISNMSEETTNSNHEEIQTETLIHSSEDITVNSNNNKLEENKSKHQENKPNNEKAINSNQTDVIEEMNEDNSTKLSLNMEELKQKNRKRINIFGKNIGKKYFLNSTKNSTFESRNNDFNGDDYNFTDSSSLHFTQPLLAKLHNYYYNKTNKSLLLGNFQPRTIKSQFDTTRKSLLSNQFKNDRGFTLTSPDGKFDSFRNKTTYNQCNIFTDKQGNILKNIYQDYSNQNMVKSNRNKNNTLLGKTNNSNLKYIKSSKLQQEVNYNTNSLFVPSILTNEEKSSEKNMIGKFKIEFLSVNRNAETLVDNRSDKKIIDQHTATNYNPPSVETENKNHYSIDMFPKTSGVLQLPKHLFNNISGNEERLKQFVGEESMNKINEEVKKSCKENLEQKLRGRKMFEIIREEFGRRTSDKQDMNYYLGKVKIPEVEPQLLMNKTDESDKLLPKTSRPLNLSDILKTDPLLNYLLDLKQPTTTFSIENNSETVIPIIIGNISHDVVQFINGLNSTILSHEKDKIGSINIEPNLNEKNTNRNDSKIDLNKFLISEREKYLSKLDLNSQRQNFYKEINQLSGLGRTGELKYNEIKNKLDEQIHSNETKFDKNKTSGYKESAKILRRFNSFVDPKSVGRDITRINTNSPIKLFLKNTNSNENKFKHIYEFSKGTYKPLHFVNERSLVENYNKLDDNDYKDKSDRIVDINFDDVGRFNHKKVSKIKQVVNPWEINEVKDIEDKEIWNVLNDVRSFDENKPNHLTKCANLPNLKEGYLLNEWSNNLNGNVIYPYISKIDNPIKGKTINKKPNEFTYNISESFFDKDQNGQNILCKVNLKISTKNYTLTDTKNDKNISCFINSPDFKKSPNVFVQYTPIYKSVTEYKYEPGSYKTIIAKTTHKKLIQEYRYVVVNLSNIFYITVELNGDVIANKDMNEKNKGSDKKRNIELNLDIIH